MKEGIHPAYKPSRVVCACGNNFETRSTHGDIHVEICAACHPFFTGKQKILDTAGRIERFKTRYAATAAKPEPVKVARPLPPPAKKVEAKENRAAKRAKVNAGKPRLTPKVEATPAEPAAEKTETPSV